MPSSGPGRNQTPPKGKEEEVPAAPPRGRTQGPDHTCPTQQGHHAQPGNRSVSRGRTRARTPRRDGRVEASPPDEDYVYPSPAGGFSPRGRPPTAAQIAYLSDAPHIEYAVLGTARGRGSGVVRPPQPSHIRREIEAAAQIARARARDAGNQEGAKEGLEKSERH